jgi:beta-lactamase regulating signal transducer with metallopeptidase domain
VSAAAHVVGWALVHFVWQGALIALAFAGVNRAARRSAPSIRYWAACAALALMMAAPLATGAWIAGAARAIPAEAAKLSGEGWRTMPLAEAEARPADAAEEAATLAPARLARRTSIAIEPLVPGLAVGWAVGVLLLSLRLLGGWLWVRRLARRGLLPVPAEWSAVLARLRAQLRIRRPVGLWISPHVGGPALIGWLRPVILLPLSASSGLTPRQVELILLHELAHVQRWDYAVNLAQRLAETLLFYHPGVWWISARIREEREHCCDDAVVARASVRDYVLALLAMEEARRPVPALALGAGGASLVARVRRLTNPARRTDTAGRTPVALAAAAALLALAAARPSPAPGHAPSPLPGLCGADAAPAGLTLCAGLGREAAGLLRGTGHAGAVIVQDVATGAVLVSTQSDSVDVTQAALPASLWKLAIAAAWWDRGWPSEDMECPAAATVAGRRISNPGRAPGVRIRVPEEMLVYSCNTAAVEMALRLSRDGGTDRLAAQLGRMGFPVAGPDAREAADPSFWASTSPSFRRAMAPLAATVHVGGAATMADLALGKEAARVTPLHFSRFLQAMGNGGVMRAPTIEAALAGSGASVRVMQPSTAARLQRAMLRTVEAGTARAAAGTQPGAWRLGGKTGTTASPRGVQGDGWFAGLVFDPAGRARYTVLTYLRQGGPGGEAPTRLAAEVAKRAIPGE